MENEKKLLQADLCYSNGKILSKEFRTIAQAKTWANNQTIPVRAKNGFLEVYNDRYAKTYHITKYGRVGRLLDHVEL